MTKKFVGVLAVCLSAACWIQTANAQQPNADFDRLPLFGTSPSDREVEDLPPPVVNRDDDRRAARDDRRSAMTQPSMQRRQLPSSLDRRPSAAEIRQARAIYAMKHRMARSERNNWLGRMPLRPQIHAVPTAAMPYHVRQSVVVPVYVLGR